MYNCTQGGFLLMAAVLFNSCASTGTGSGATITATGVVHDINTAAPITGVPLQLEVFYNNGGTAFPATTTSGSSGTFSFSTNNYPNGTVSNYSLNVMANNNYFISYYTWFNSPNASNIIFNIQSKAFLKLHVINSTPFNAYDSIVINPTVYDATYGTIKGSLKFKFIGAKIDTTFMVTNSSEDVLGNTVDNITYQVTKNNTISNSSFNVSLAPFVTNSYTLNY